MGETNSCSCDTAGESVLTLFKHFGFLPEDVADTVQSVLKFG
jgi:hypothetical protein